MWRSNKDNKSQEEAKSNEAANTTGNNWSPFNCPLHQRRKQMFNSFFSSRSRGEWFPPVDISEEDESYRLIADLPEMKKEDIHVYTENPNAICISGNRQHLEKPSDRPMIVAERGAGRFERCFDLPTHVDEENVKATFKDHQLCVEVPKLRTTKKGTSNAVPIE